MKEKKTITQIFQNSTCSSKQINVCAESKLYTHIVNISKLLRV